MDYLDDFCPKSVVISVSYIRAINFLYDSRGHVRVHLNVLLNSKCDVTCVSSDTSPCEPEKQHALILGWPLIKGPVSWYCYILISLDLAHKS